MTILYILSITSFILSSLCTLFLGLSVYSAMKQKKILKSMINK